MEIHIYALCWNEERMLPYFFKHYDKIADKYFIFDNNSTDNSFSILKSHPKVSAIKIDLKGNSVVEAAREQYNHFWKQSRGVADWVIVCNVDEHFYHPDLRNYLQKCTSSGITLITPTGYEMVSNTFPNDDKPLCETLKYGVRREYLDKPQMFNPNEIQEINFLHGRHNANPVGNIRKSTQSEVLLLHYKYLGYEYVSIRHPELKSRLREADIANRFGFHYLWDEKKRREIITELQNEAKKIL